MRWFVSCLSAAFLSIAGVTARAQSPGRTESALSQITTSGRGEARITPDRATVLVTIETRGGSAADATATNNKTTAATIKALKAATSAGDIVTTESFTVGRDYDNKGHPTNFVARNSIRSQLQNTAEIGQVIDAALNAGATQIMPVQFTGSRTPDARREAVKAAVIQARLDAESMAEAAGGTLGKLLMLTSSVIPSRTSYEMVVATSSLAGGLAREAAPPPPMLPNDLTVSAIVSGSWEFMPRH
jgi:uncharacterized protein YggE